MSETGNIFIYYFPSIYERQEVPRAYQNLKMHTYIVAYLLLHVLKKCWCQLPEDGDIITPKHVGTTKKSFLRHCDLTRLMASLFLGFIDHKQRRTTVGRTPLDE
jgi:hypothetical protein